MEALEKFYQWFLRLGGKVPKDLSGEIKAKFEAKPQVRTSLRPRAEEIKAKYNYKFKNPLNNYPDISKLNFEKK